MTTLENLTVVSANVRAEIGRANRSQAQLQRALNISGTRWQRCMRHGEAWTLGELSRIARELGIPVRQLFDGAL